MLTNSITRRRVCQQIFFDFLIYHGNCSRFLLFSSIFFRFLGFDFLSMSHKSIGKVPECSNMRGKHSHRGSAAPQCRFEGEVASRSTAYHAVWRLPMMIYFPFVYDSMETVFCCFSVIFIFHVRRCGSPVEISAAGRSTDRADRRDRTYVLRIVLLTRIWLPLEGRGSSVKTSAEGRSADRTDRRDSCHGDKDLSRD